MSCKQVQEIMGSGEVLLIDLRDDGERDRHGVLPGSVHVPYVELEESVSDGGVLKVLAESTDKRIVFYCAYGERSAMAVQAAQESGIDRSCHITGGLDAWKKCGLPLESIGGSS